MPDYGSLAALRDALTSDDPDTRAEAYQAVLETDTKVSAVLGGDVSDEVVATLVEADVIPEGGTASPPVSENWERALELLESIEANTGGS